MGIHSLVKPKPEGSELRFKNKQSTIDTSAPSLEIHMPVCNSADVSVSCIYIKNLMHQINQVVLAQNQGGPSYFMLFDVIWPHDWDRTLVSLAKDPRG